MSRQRLSLKHFRIVLFIWRFLSHSQLRNSPRIYGIFPPILPAPRSTRIKAELAYIYPQLTEECDARYS